MIEWHDEGIVLAARPHGESAMVVQLLTRGHGRHAGLVQGGQSRRSRGIYQPGNLLAAVWRARLSEHLGTFTCEALESHGARLIDRPERLLALSAAASIAEQALPEREEHAGCFESFVVLLQALQGEHWAEVYVRWELGLLSELGYGLDLSDCAAGGANDQLAFVSPRSARAVSLAAGEPYRDRLLPLPAFLIGGEAAGREEVEKGLSLTGYFLAKHVFSQHDRDLPAPRKRLAARFEEKSR